MTPQRLRQWRQKLGLTQGEMAQRLSVGLRTYHRWEREGNIPPVIGLALRQIEQVRRKEYPSESRDSGKKAKGDAVNRTAKSTRRGRKRDNR
jgi:DNA-binding XRE family transcriptional regulator